MLSNATILLKVLCIGMCINVLFLVYLTYKVTFLEKLTFNDRYSETRSVTHSALTLDCALKSGLPFAQGVEEEGEFSQVAHIKARCLNVERAVTDVELIHVLTTSPSLVIVKHEGTSEILP